MNKKEKQVVIREKRKINLALQGGGAHGGFTFGVLERLLEEENLEIEAIGGTSAGAMNASIVGYGLLIGGRKKARELLEEFWKQVSAASNLTPLVPSFFDKMLGSKSLNFSPNFMAVDYITRMFSPYQFNIFDYNPLRDILTKLIDFEYLRKHSKTKLFINATNVKTGKIKVFTDKELNIQMLMASACLPYLYKAVEVDGEFYWDGGYSGNPALFPLFYNTLSEDIILVQVTPFNIDEVPTQAQEIMDRINEISFNSTLLREMRAIAFVSKLLEQQKLDSGSYKNIRIHLIEAEDIMGSLGSISKLNADWEFVDYLRAIGRQSADDWINNHYDKLGKESSIDIKSYL